MQKIQKDEGGTKGGFLPSVQGKPRRATADWPHKLICRALAASTAFASVMIFHAPGAFASPPVFLDFHSDIPRAYPTAAPLERSFGITSGETYASFAIKINPLTDAALCELDLWLKKGGSFTAGEVAVSVIASPSSPFFYSFQADTKIGHELVGSSFAAKRFSFYNADPVEVKPLGVSGTVWGLPGELDPGSCPVLYGGHEYWIFAQGQNMAGTSPRFYYSYYPVDFSRATSRALFRTDLSRFIQSPEDEIEARMYGFSAFAERIGSPLYENANPADWVSSASYSFEEKDFGRLGNMFRDVLLSLFRPGNDIAGKWASLSGEIKKKPPIGYFWKIKEHISGLATSSAEDETLAQVYAATKPVVDPLKTGLSIVAALATAAYLFRRTSSISL